MRNQWLRMLTGACVCVLCLSMVSGCKKTEKAVIEQVTNPVFTAEDIRELKVTNDGEVSYQLVYEPRKDRESYLYWDMPIPYESIATVDTEEIYKLFRVFAGIDIKSGKQDESREKITDSDTTITVSYYQADEETNNNSQEPIDTKPEHPEPNKTATILVGEKEDNAYACAIEGNDAVYLIKDYLIDSVLNEKPYDMILKVPFLLDIKSVKEVHMEWGDKKAVLKSSKDGGSLNGEAIDQKTYRSLYAMTFQCGMTGEIPDGLDVLKGKDEILRLDYLRTDSEFEEYQVSFYAYDESNDAVRINGKVAFLVSKDDVETLLACLDKL